MPVVKKLKKAVSSKKETQKEVKQVKNYTPPVVKKKAKKVIKKVVAKAPKRLQPVIESELKRLSKSKVSVL